MKKTYKLTGVDCANCAAKIEDRIAKLEGVKECSVNFIMQKLIIEAEDQDFDSIIEKASAIAKKVDREAKITAK
jgi:copper chaperone CopZ